MTTCDRINIIWNCIPSFYINIIVIKKIGLLVSAYIKVTKIITLYYSELIFMWAYVWKDVVLFMTLNVIMLSIQNMEKHNLLWFMTSIYLNSIFLFYIYKIGSNIEYIDTYSLKSCTHLQLNCSNNIKLLLERILDICGWTNKMVRLAHANNM